MRESFFVGCLELKFAEVGGKKWVQILKIGEYKHPKYGTFKITADVLKALAESFRNNVRKIKSAFNYSHETSPAHGTIAAGWINDVDVRGSEFWVSVDWTPKAFEAINDKEFLYTSAEFFTEYEDAETGKVTKWVLKGAALTNTPFIKGMNAIAASELLTNEEKKPMKLSEITVDLLENHSIDFLKIRADVEKFAEMQPQFVVLTEENKTLKTKAIADTAALKLLGDKVTASDKATADVKFATLVKDGMADGKITKVFAEGQFVEMHEKMGFEACETYIKNAEKVIDTGDNKGGEGGVKVDNTSKDADAQLNELAEALMAKDKELEFGDAVNQVLEANPKLAAAYAKMSE